MQEEESYPHSIHTWERRCQESLQRAHQQRSQKNAASKWRYSVLLMTAAFVVLLGVILFVLNQVTGGTLFHH